MTRWYNAYNKITHESQTIRSNNPIGVAFEMLGGDKYKFTEIGDNHWLVDDKLEIRELKNINPNSLLK